MSPEKIRNKNTELVDSRNNYLGINSSVFSSNSGVLEMASPGNGVKLSAKNSVLGTGRYVNSNKSKMSLADYQSIANFNQKSLANIAIRG